MITAQISVTNARIEPVGASTPSTPLNVKSSQLTLDRTWSPYIQGSLVVPLMSAADKAATDPRSGLCVKFTLNLTYQGVTQTYSVVAYLRSAVSDFVAGTTTLTFASGESLMQDMFLTNQIPPSSQDVATYDTTMVTSALNAQAFYDSAFTRMTLTTLDGTAAQAYTIPANTPQPTGQDCWSYILAIEEPFDIWVRGDETGNIVRSAPTYAADTSTHTISDQDRIVNVLDSVSRDDPNWGSEVLVQYTGNSTGWDYTEAATTAPPVKYAQFTRNASFKKAGAASRLLARTKRRGRALTISAIADLSARPNQTWQASFQGYTWTGIVRSVAWATPDATMTLVLDGIDS